MESTTDANLSLIFDSQENNNPQQLKQFDGKLTNRNFNPSSILNEVDINRNNNEQFNEDDLNLLNINYNCNSVRPSSNRRSSILKTNFEKNEIRNSRRVSWAQTYQFKKLLEDGTTVVTSQELNKFGPEPLRKSTELAATTSTATGQNLASSNENNQNDPANPTADEEDSQQNAEMVKQKVQLKVANKNYTKVLSKYYNTEDKKDYQTVVNTAANRFGIDPTTTDLSKLLDLDQNSAVVLEPPKNEADRQQAEANSENIKIFLKQFNKSQERNSNLNILMKALEKNVSNSTAKKTKTNVKSQPKPKEKLDDSLEKIFETELTNNNNMSLIFDSSKVYNSANLHNSTKLSTDQPSSQDFWNQMSMLDESSITINHSKDSPVEITKLTVPGEMSPGGNFEIFIDDQTCQAKVVVPPVVVATAAECMSIHDTTMMAISNDQEEDGDEQPVPVEDSNKKNDADNFLMKLPEYSGNLSSMFTDSSDDSGLLVVPSAVVSIGPKNISLVSSNIHEDSQKENGIVDLSNNKLLIEESKPNKQLVDNICESENLEDLLEVTEKIAFHEKLTMEEDQDDDNLTLTNVFTCNNLEMELEQQKQDQTLVAQTNEDSSQQPMGEDQIAPISMIEETDLSVCVESQKENIPIEIVTSESSQKQNIVNANDFDLNQEEDMAIDEETVANFDAANFICKLQSQVDSQKNSSAKLETTEILMIEETVLTSETEKIDETLKTFPEDSQKENQQQSMAIEDTNLSFSAILVDKKLEILSESQFPDSQKENLVSDCSSKKKSVEKVFEILSESMVISDSQKENFVSDCPNKKKNVEKVYENLSESMVISDSQKENEPVFQISNKISSQETATGILGFFNGTIGNCSSITNDEGQSTIEKFAENTKAANFSSSMVGNQKVQEVQLLSKTTDENQSSISFKTIPCNFNTSGFGQENSKLCTPIPVLSSTRIVNEMNVADCSNEELEERTTGSLKKCPELTMNDGDRTEFSEFTLRANEDQDELTVDEVSHMDLDDFDDDDDNGRMSKSFQNSSNVSIVMVDTGNENRDTRPFPHDDDDNSVPIKVEVYEITNNKLDRDDDDEEEHTAYVPTKPFLGKAALLLEDEEEEEETQVDDEEKSPEEMQITEVVEPSIELATNHQPESSPPLRHNLDRTNQSLGKPIEFDQSNLTGFKRPCEFGSTNFLPLKKSSPSPAENKTSSSSSSAQVSSIPVLPASAAANFRSSKSKTSQFNIPFASLNMELANLDRNNVELSSISSTTSTTTTTAVINRSFLPLLPQIGGNRRSISSTTSLFSRFNQNRLSNQSISLFNRGQTTVLTQQQKIQTEMKPKNPIELDFNKSQEASLIKTPSKSNKNCLTRENDSGEKQQFNTQQFIRKSLGLNLREMLLEKLKKREEEEEVAVEKSEPKATNVSCVIQSMTQILDQTESRDCSKIDEDSAINANRPSISATMEEEMELDESKCSANRMSVSSISFTGTSSKLLELIQKQSDSPLPITTKIQPLETESLTELPLNSNKSMQTTTKVFNQSMVDADETYLNSIITADDEDDELDDDAKVFFNQSINFSMHFVDDEEEEDESPPITLNATSKMTKRRESIIPSVDSGKQPEVSVVSSSSSMEVSQNSLTLTPQSDESIFNFTLSPWRREYSRVEDYNKIEATLEYRYTQMFDAFEEANYCQTLKMDRKLYGSILRLNLDELNIRIQKFESDQFVARFLWSTVELRVRFGSTVAKTPNKSKTSTSSNEVIREIIALDILSLIDSNRELPQRIMAGKEDCPLYDAECYDLKFLEEHRSILLLAHDYVLCHFTEKRDQLMHKYRNSCDLSQLLTEISLIVSSGRKMAREVRTIFSGEVCQFIPLDSDGKFRICVELLALRKPIELHLAFNPLMYPDEVIRPTIVVPDKDKHLYPLDQFSSALLMIKPGNFNYIKRLIRASRYFIKALRIVMRQIRRSRKQSEAIKLARLEPSPRQSILPPVVAVHDDPPKFA